MSRTSYPNNKTDAAAKLFAPQRLLLSPFLSYTLQNNLYLISFFFYLSRWITCPTAKKRATRGCVSGRGTQPMLIFIGSTARTGKGMLVRRLLAEMQPPFLSLDVLKMGLERGWP